jgi:BASS family bile acid:Na+ symporter
MLELKTVVDVGAPALAFVTLLAIGIDLVPADFARLRRVPAVVAAGLVAPLLLLPAIAVALIWWLRPDPVVEAGVLLVAACPIGGISNTYSYLARASTELSVTLTGASCMLAILAIPLLTGAFEQLLGVPVRVDAPMALLGLQLVFMLALPLGLGMMVRRRWPGWADGHRRWFQRLAWAMLALLLVTILTIEADRVAAMFREVVAFAAVFVAASFAAGWMTGSVVGANGADRFTLAAEFATRNVAIAATIAVTMLGRTEFALFGSVYFLTELPLMLSAVAAWRWCDAHPRR